MSARHAGSESEFTALARAGGGAFFFSLPLLMTMEMWWLGSYLDRGRLAILLLLHFPVLVGLSYHSGFEETFSLKHDAVDAAVAFGVGTAIGALVLWVFNVVHAGEPFSDVVGKVVLQAVPASFGALLANSQFAANSKESGKRRRNGYGTELFLMLVGSIFLAFNLAPTQEMIVIAYKLTYPRALLLVFLTVVMMHGFVYAASFRGRPEVPRSTPFWKLFLEFTLVGYVVALAVSAYVLWTFGRVQDHAFSEYLLAIVVLGFPSGLGAAAARLII